MIERQVTLPTIALIAGTRAALGIGIGLLLAGRFSPEQRRAMGWALFAVGVLSTIPLAAEVLDSGQPCRTEDLSMQREPSRPFAPSS